MIPRDFRKLIRKKLLGVEVDTYFFSQCGEDAIISSIFTYEFPTQNGFYIDVGAYHPTKGSNTYLLYRSGWRGINIDPNPFAIELFNKDRPGDINLAFGISKEKDTLNYYIIDKSSTMNSFSFENLEKIGMHDRVKEVRKIPVYPLSYISEEYLSQGKKVDFLNIDAEGFEMEILESNDWEKVKPKVIAIEQGDVLSFEDVERSTVCLYLKQKGYQPVAKNYIIKGVATVIYLLKS
jgi:FkbM family methyltransferase